MKVVAINASPKMDKGNTALILDPFLDGIKEAGAVVEIFYTRKLNINPCQGEFNCWVKTPGECFQKDDMEMILAKMNEAEIWVFATPVYVDGISGPLKNLLDRIIPILYPFFELREGHCRHPRRESVKTNRLALVSNSGFWEMDNFDPLLVHMKAVCKNANIEFSGALLRPHGPALKSLLDMGAPLTDILDAAKEAGRQLVQDGKMSPDTLEAVSRELLPLDMYKQVANDKFQNQLDMNSGS